MKKSKKSFNIRRMMSILLVLSMVLAVPGNKIQVKAVEISNQNGSEATAQTGSDTESTENEDANGTLGKNTDIGIEVTKSITGKAGKNVTISFVLKSSDKNTVKLKSVYPVIDNSFPFETSGDAYKVVTAGSDADKQAKLSASFKMKAREDIVAGYHGIRFIGEYTKTAKDGTETDYYVIKTINIYFQDTTSSSGSNSGNSGGSSDDFDDDSSSDDTDYDGGSDTSDDAKETSAPKLLITGYDTDPKTIMAGEKFKLTIHIKNTSKTTSVCNGKFLVGNEAGNFLPTSGSSAVFIEKIPAGETGDLEIELKTSADLPQKNYILVVKGDFDDGNGNNFTSSDNLSLPVNQKIRLGVSDVSVTPDPLGIDMEGSLVFTINNQSNAGVYNATVLPKDEAVTGEEVYVGNIAASSSAYVTMNLTGAKDNSETGTIKVEISYEDASGNKETVEETINCVVSQDAEPMEEDWAEEYDADFEDEGSGWSSWLLILLVVLAIIAVIVIIVLLVRRKKKRLAQLLEEEDLEEDGLEDNGPEEDSLQLVDLINGDTKKDGFGEEELKDEDD